MEFLTASLLELIVQTSTNLPPDARAAMSLAAGSEIASRCARCPTDKGPSPVIAKTALS